MYLHCALVKWKLHSCKYLQVNKKFWELKGGNIGIAEKQRRQDLVRMS